MIEASRDRNDIQYFWKSYKVIVRNEPGHKNAATDVPLISCGSITNIILLNYLTFDTNPQQIGDVQR